MQHSKPSFSLLVGGGQAYYGPTAERDYKVVTQLAKYLSSRLIFEKYRIQVVTGGTAGIPDDFADAYTLAGGSCVDIVSSEYLPEYKKRTDIRPRSYWVAGQTQEKRRLAFLTNPDIKVALFIQGGQYTTHEIKLCQERGIKTVVFWGSGGASGGKLAFRGWKYTKKHDAKTRAYFSEDPEANVNEIVADLAFDILEDFM